jgi:hypothetical protein
MTLTSTNSNGALVADGTPSAPWAAKAQAEIAALYHQFEGHDPNDAAMITWTRQLIAGSAAI